MYFMTVSTVHQGISLVMSMMCKQNLKVVLLRHSSPWPLWLVKGRPGLHEGHVVIRNACWPEVIRPSHLHNGHFTLRKIRTFTVLTTPPTSGPPLIRTVWFELF